MGKYSNLNEIVHYYKVWRDDSDKELRDLKKGLSNIPVKLKKFKLSKFEYDFSDCIVCAEVHNPGGRIFLLDDLVSYEEADEITERMVMPYLILQINSKPLSNDFYTQHKGGLRKLVLPDERDETAKVLGSSRIPAIAIMYERKKPGEERDIHYIEMRLTKD